MRQRFNVDIEYVQYILLLDLLYKLDFSDYAKIEMVKHKSPLCWTGITINSEKDGVYVSFRRDNPNIITCKWYSKVDFEVNIDVANSNWVQEAIDAIMSNTKF